MEETVVRMWTGFKWLRIGSVGRSALVNSMDFEIL
jgi:hypothetical protein